MVVTTVVVAVMFAVIRIPSTALITGVWNSSSRRRRRTIPITPR
jgi:hypothetical protein